MNEDVVGQDADVFDPVVSCINKLLELAVPSPNDFFDDISEFHEINEQEVVTSTDIGQLRDLLLLLLTRASPLFPEIYNYNAILIMKDNVSNQKHQLRALLYFIPEKQRNVLLSLFEFLHLSHISTEKLTPHFVNKVFKASFKLQCKFEAILSVYIEHYNFMSFNLTQTVPGGQVPYELKARTISAFPPEYNESFLEVPANVVIDIVALNSPEWAIGRYKENNGMTQPGEDGICGFIAMSFLKLIPEKFTLPERTKNECSEDVAPKLMVIKRNEERKSRQSASLVFSQTIYCEICFKVPIENPSKCEYCAKHIQPKCCYECLVSLTCLNNASCPLCGHELNKKSKVIPLNPVPERVITPSNSPTMEKKWKNDYKISALGITGVGKTSLIIHYVFGKFVEQKDNTIADIYRKTSIVNDVPCLIQISDFEDKKADGFILIYSNQVEKSRDYVVQTAERLVEKYKRFVIVRNDFEDTPMDEDICLHKIFNINGSQSINNFSFAIEELVGDIRATESRPKKTSKCDLL